MRKVQWILCPVCGGKTRNQIREDTVLKKFPLFCPKCKQETLIDAEKLNIVVIKEPDAQTQSLQIARNREE
ncbi:MAG: cysteine-rich KTR domain-containing protein [Oscillospiraceae bacterium]|nr:cysteine-rich KTR domain-containing protein [Oscillospiraceae bacterium]